MSKKAAMSLFLFVLFDLLGPSSARASTPCNPRFTFLGVSQDGNQLYWQQEVGGECVPALALYRYDFSKGQEEVLSIGMLEGYEPDPQDPTQIPLVDYKRRKRELVRKLQKPTNPKHLTLRFDRTKNGEKGVITVASGKSGCVLADPIFKDWESYLVLPAKGIQAAYYIAPQRAWWVVTRHCNSANAPYPEETCPEDEGLALYSIKRCE
jgi:hypothetical protein